MPSRSLGPLLTEGAALTCAGNSSARNYHRSDHLPNAAPANVVAAMPSPYQIATNGRALSSQENAYTHADAEPARRPTAAPANVSRVGAMPRMVQSPEARTGAASNMISHGHEDADEPIISRR